MDKRHCPNEDITWPVVADAMAKEIQHRYKTWPALLEACEKGQKRLSFLQRKIVDAKLIVVGGVEIRKTASCIAYIEAAIAQGKE